MADEQQLNSLSRFRKQPGRLVLEEHGHCEVPAGGGVVLRRRNPVLLPMSVEIMLNAVNLILVTADTTVRAALPHTGQVFALFVIGIAAAEVGVGLAIVLQLYRLRASVAVDEVPLDAAPQASAAEAPQERVGA